MSDGGYRLVRGLARLLLALFYRRVEVIGLEQVPASGPLIVAANHQNALVDPMLLLGTIPRQLRPLAKAPLFRHPLIGPFLRLAGALPVQRRQDSGSDPAQNTAMFLAPLGPTAFFALTWRVRLDRVHRDTRGFLRCLRDRDLFRRLLARRRALMEELRALARLVPGAVLVGEPDADSEPVAPKGPG